MSWRFINSRRHIQTASIGLKYLLEFLKYLLSTFHHCLTRPVSSRLRELLTCVMEGYSKVVNNLSYSFYQFWYRSQHFTGEVDLIDITKCSESLLGILATILLITTVTGDNTYWIVNSECCFDIIVHHL